MGERNSLSRFTVSSLPSSVLRWNSQQIIKFAKEKEISLPTVNFVARTFLKICIDVGPEKAAVILGIEAIAIYELYIAIKDYLSNHLVEALLEEFQIHEIPISDHFHKKLTEKCIENHEELLKIYMEFNKPTLLKLYKSLNQVERSRTFKELRVNDIYLDGIIHQGYSGICIYEALKNSTPVVCKYFPSSAISEAEREWNINRTLHEKVNNSQYVIVYKERLQTSSGGFYLIMENYGSWSLLDIAAKKFKDNFYQDNLNPKFPTNLLKRICCSVLSGLKSLELIGYYHSDIKLGNIMLAHDGTPTIIDLVEVVAER
jgi:hypothetical protein